MRHALLALGFPMGQVQQYIDTVRKDSYDTTYTGLEELHLLDQLVATVRGLEIAWHAIRTDSSLAGMTLAEANIRARNWCIGYCAGAQPPGPSQSEVKHSVPGRRSACADRRAGADRPGRAAHSARRQHHERSSPRSKVAA